MQSGSSSKNNFPSRDLFKQICEIARNNFPTEIAKEIKKVLPVNSCIDVRNEVGFTPASQLAAEGKFEAVEELKKLGAHVNGIAKGAAYGHHRKFAEKLRREYDVNPNEIAIGAAQGGDRAYAEFLRQECNANVRWIAAGAALGGQWEYVEYLLEYQGTPLPIVIQFAAQGGYLTYAEKQGGDSNGALKNYTLRGAARRGDYREYIERHRKTLQFRELETWRQFYGWFSFSVGYSGDSAYVDDLLQEERSHLKVLATGAAYGGHRWLTEKLRAEPGVPIIDDIAYGAAKGGHNSYVEFLLQQGANPSEVACSAASNGELAYVEQLLNTFPHICLRTIIQGAVMGGHLWFLEKLSRKPDNWVSIAASDATHFDELRTKKSVLQWLLSLSHVKDRINFVSQINRIKELNLISKPNLVQDVDLSALLRLAQEIHQTRVKKCGLNYDQILAWRQPAIHEFSQRYKFVLSITNFSIFSCLSFFNPLRSVAMLELTKLRGGQKEVTKSQVVNALRLDSNRRLNLFFQTNLSEKNNTGTDNVILNLQMAFNIKLNR